MLCLVFEPGATGCQALTIPLSFCGQPVSQYIYSLAIPYFYTDFHAAFKIDKTWSAIRRL